MNTPVNTQKLANWLITKASQSEKFLTPRKLKALIVQAEMVFERKFDSQLVNEPLDCNESGPFFLSLLHEYKEKPELGIIEFPSRRQPPLEPDEDLETFLNNFWKTYSKYNDRQLERFILRNISECEE
jgi:uncharacterized phage-associated protein